MSARASAAWSVRQRRLRAACCTWALLGAAAPAAGAGAAATAPLRDHAVPSCYEQLREHAPADPERDLTVLIDQTTPTDPRLRQIAAETVTRLLRPGTRITVASFSAFSQGRYLDVLVSGLVERPIAGKARDFVPKRPLQVSDRCLDEQLGFARRLVNRTMDSAFAGSDPGLARSDILATLHDLSRRLGDVRVGQRMVVVVSDMLENSSISSFYQATRPRRLDAMSELRRAREAGIRPDFHGAQVVVIGAGAVSERSGDLQSYRDPRVLLALEAFWRDWFAAHRAELVEFGKPTPLIEVRWREVDRDSGLARSLPATAHAARTR